MADSLDDIMKGSEEKGERPQINITHVEDVEEEAPTRNDLRRGLQARHITMITLGGAIGTKMLVGSGTMLATSGPAPLFIGFSIAGLICFLVTTALGEMAAWLPGHFGFAAYAVRFVHPAFGYVLGWAYFTKIIVLTSGNITAAATLVQFWVPTDKVNLGVFIAIAIVFVVGINFLNVRSYGEVKFWVSGIQIIFLIGLIFLSLILASGGGPDHSATGFQYWNNPGAFHEYLVTGSTGRFLAVYSTFSASILIFSGTELVGFTVGETANPRKAIPRAIKLIFSLFIGFYVILVLLMGLIVPYTAKPLALGTSPFMIAIQNSGIKALPSIFNACLVLCALSSASSNLYVSSRILYGLCLAGMAPKHFYRTDTRGVPIFALGLCTLYSLMAFLNLEGSLSSLFSYFGNFLNYIGLLTWISILFTHICFVRARRAQNIPDTALVYTAPLGIWGSIGAMCFTIIVALFIGFAQFFYKSTAASGTTPKFDIPTFVTMYAAIPIFAVVFLAYKFIAKVHMVKPEEADLYSGKEQIDTEEEEFVAREQARREGTAETRIEKIYRITTGRFL